MKLWVSTKVKPEDPTFTYCDSLLSAYEQFIKWKKHQSGSMLIAGDKAADSEITDVFCDEEYSDVITRYLARQFTLAPMPRIHVLVTLI